MTDVFEIWADRKYTPKVSASRAFDITVADNVEAARTAMEAQYGIVEGAAFPYGIGLKVATGGITIDAAKGPQHWRGSVNYDPIAPFSGGTLQKPKIAWQMGFASEPTDSDIAKNPIINTAGDPLVPPPYTELLSLFLTMTRSEAKYLVGEALRFVGSTNSNPFNIYHAGPVKRGQIRCMSIIPPGEYFLGTNEGPLDVAYRFELRADGFKKRILNQGRNGFAYSGAGSHQKLPITVKNTQSGRWEPVTHDVRLDLDGVPLDWSTYGFRVGNGLDPTPNPAAPNLVEEEWGEDKAGPDVVGYDMDPKTRSYFLHFRMFKEVDFGPLILTL